ncbi:MAG: archaeosortase/exosortase family protein [Verrucomicrobiota bacterium]
MTLKKWVSLSVWIIVTIIFYPITLWVLRNTIAEEQLKHSLLVLGFAGVALAMERKERLQFIMEFGEKSTWSLVISFVLVTVSAFFKWPLAMMMGYAFAIYACALYLLGEKFWRGIAALVIAFSVYMVLVISMPIFDWPLRGASAIGGKWMLDQTGLFSHLSVQFQDPIKLLLWLEEKPFEVAAECNGFGSMSGAILLAILLGIYRRGSFLSIIGAVTLAILISYLFNILRIFSICLFALGLPETPDYYFVMHEIVGTFYFWGCILVLWCVLRKCYPSR